MKFLDTLQTIGQPDQTELRTKLESNPQSVVNILDDFLNHRTYQTLSERIPDGNERYGYEWMVNPFQFATQAIIQNEDKDYFQGLLLEFAKYLRDSTIWNRVAPHFFDSSAWTRVFRLVIEYCPPSLRQELAHILNRYGLLQKCFDVLGYSREVVKREWSIDL